MANIDGRTPDAPPVAASPSVDAASGVSSAASTGGTTPSLADLQRQVEQLSRGHSRLQSERDRLASENQNLQQSVNATQEAEGRRTLEWARSAPAAEVGQAYVRQLEQAQVAKPDPQVADNLRGEGRQQGQREAMEALVGAAKDRGWFADEAAFSDFIADPNRTLDDLLDQARPSTPSVPEPTASVPNLGEGAPAVQPGHITSETILEMKRNGTLNAAQVAEWYSNDETRAHLEAALAGIRSV